MSFFSSIKFLLYPEKINGLLGVNWQKVTPVKADVDATNICNQDCVWCYVSEFRKRSPVSMSKEEMLFTLEQVSQLGCEAVLFSGAGEPLCNSKVFPEAFFEARELGMKCALTTNGTLLDKYAQSIAETCTYVKVSVDAGSRETYRKLHRSDDWTLVWHNINKLKNVFDGILGVDFLLHPENYTEVHNFLSLALKHNLSYAGVRPLLRSQLKDDAIASVNNQLKLFRGKNKFPVFARMKGRIGRDYTKCYATPLAVTICADMNVYPCCVNRGIKDLAFGNLHEQSLRKIWEGEKRKRIVESIDATKCLPCKYNRTNKILNELKRTVHKEFI